MAKIRTSSHSYSLILPLTLTLYLLTHSHSPHSLSKVSIKVAAIQYPIAQHADFAAWQQYVTAWIQEAGGGPEAALAASAA